MQLLGWTLFQEGRFADAEQLQRKVLETRQRVLGPDNNDTLSVRSDLANNLDTQGNHAEAETMERDILERRRRTLGPDNAYTLASMDTLALILTGEKRFAEAEKLESQALATARRVYGDANLDTIHYTLNEAAIQGLMGKNKESEASLRQLLELEQRVLRPDQPETAVTMYNLASEVAKSGNVDEALALLRRSIDHGLLPRYAEGIGEDPELKALHGAPGFAALVAYAKQHAAAQKAR
jgi:tetratricopeptide (TPR) repeat protein